MRPRRDHEEFLRIEVEEDGPKIRGFLHAPPLWPKVPCVVLCHGLLSSMESPKFSLLASELRQRGIAALRFDFRGCGESEGSLEESNVSARLTDLMRMVGVLREKLGHRGPLGMMGSSMGGFVVLLACKQIPQIVSATCVWATPFAPMDLIQLGRGKEAQLLGPSFYEDLRHHSLSDLHGKLSRILVIHGEKDEIVPLEHALKIHDLAVPPKKLWVVKGGDHRLSDPDHRKEATRLTVEWFEEHLIGGPSS